MIKWKPIVTSEFLSIVLIILILTTGRIGQAEDTFELGNQAYAQGNYSLAVQNYLATIEELGASASLLYNLANAYAKTEKTGEAIRAYEQALRLDHGNGNIRSNLAIIRKKNGLYQEDSPLWQRFSDLLGADQWMLLSGLFFFIFSGSLLIRSLAGSFIVRIQKDIILRITSYTTGVALLAILITLPAAVYCYQSWNDGVVLTDSRLLISPFAAAASGGTIREGRLIRPIKNHKEFVLVIDNSGQKGWLERKQLGLIRDLPRKNKKTEP